MSFELTLIVMGLATLAFAGVMILWFRHEGRKLDREFGSGFDKR